MPRSAESRISEFLDTHPSQPLRVAVGYASVWGLAWLGRHTQGRSVELLIGDCRKHRFEIGTETDRKTARQFLSRNDVMLRNWYTRRDQARSAHIKAWQTTDSTGQIRILSGSANLSQQGLRHNTEAMGEYSGQDRTEAVRSMNDLFAKSWDAKERVLGYLQDADQVSHSRAEHKTEAAQTTTAAQTTYSGSAHRRSEPSRSARQQIVARKAPSSSANRRSAGSRSGQSKYTHARRPVNRRQTRRRPSSNRRKSSTSSGFLKLWWMMPPRVREGVFSLLMVAIAVTALLIWLNITDDNNDADFESPQTLSQTAPPQTSPTPTQLPNSANSPDQQPVENPIGGESGQAIPASSNPPDLQLADGVSCKTHSNQVTLSDRPVQIITETVCSSLNPDGEKTYWQCQEVRGDQSCYGGQPDPCGTESMGYPLSPIALQGILIYNEPQPDCQGGFNPSEWIFPDSRQIVPASEAWRSGGFNWNAHLKQDFLIDPENTWEDGQTWPTVSDDSSTLLASAPPETQCQLATRWVDIKKKYNLNADSSEVSTLQAILTSGC